MMHDTLREDMKTALKARDEIRLTTIRGLVSSLTNELVSLKRKPSEKLSDEEVITVIKRAVKQRKDSIEQFEKGGRQDLADIEKKELAILEAYMPAGASQEEIEAAVLKAIADNPTIDASKSGMLVGIVMKSLNGNADGTVVKEIITQKLS